MFTILPTYNRYRTLMVTAPQQQGEDVFALQTALNDQGFPVGALDGILGVKTGAAITAAQKSLHIVADGKAGGGTQKELAMAIASKVAVALDIPISAFMGQLEFESGFRLGNYSPPRADNTYDAGVAQRNTRHTPPEQGFDPAASITALGNVIRQHYDLFVGLAPHRRWALAQGAWNAPAFACYIAREEGATQVTKSMTAQPYPEARAIFEAYVAHASVYLTV
jgi:Putative peptidoglycan binding domain